VDAPDRDLHGACIEEQADGAGGRRTESEIHREGIGGAKRYDAESNLGSDQALENFMDGAIAATGEDGVATAADSSQGLQAGGAGSVGFEGSGFNSRGTEHGESVRDDALALLRVLAGKWVVDEGDLTHCCSAWAPSIDAAIGLAVRAFDGVEERDFERDAHS